MTPPKKKKTLQYEKFGLVYAAMPSIAEVIQHQMIRSSMNNKEENMWEKITMPPSICLEGVRKKQKSSLLKA